MFDIHVNIKLHKALKLHELYRGGGGSETPFQEELGKWAGTPRPGKTENRSKDRCSSHYELSVYKYTI